MKLKLFLSRLLELKVRIVELLVFTEAAGEGAFAVLEQSSLVHCEVFVADLLLDPGQLGNDRLLCAGIKTLLVLLSVVLLLCSGFLAGLFPFGNVLCTTILVLGWRLGGLA